MSLVDGPVYFPCHSGGRTYFIWSFLANDLWNICCCDGSNWWHVKLNPIQRAHQDDSSISVKDHLSLFVSGLRGSYGHVSVSQDGSVVLAVWVDKVATRGGGGQQDHHHHNNNNNNNNYKVERRFTLPPVQEQDSRNRLMMGMMSELVSRVNVQDNPLGQEVKRLQEENSRLASELMALQRKSGGGGGDVDDDEGGMVNWNAGLVSKTKKPKRDVDGAVLTPTKKSKKGRDIVNPSQVARHKKKKVVEYKGLPSATASNE